MAFPYELSHRAIKIAYPHVGTIHDAPDGYTRAYDKESKEIIIDPNLYGQAEKIVHYEQSVRSVYQTRVEQYPQIGEQLDDLYHAGLFSDEMTARIKEVKIKNPVPQPDESIKHYLQ